MNDEELADLFNRLKSGEAIRPAPMEDARKKPSDVNGDGAATRRRGTWADQRFHCLNQLVDKSAKSVSPLEIAVWFVIYRNIQRKSRTATISQTHIGQKLGKRRETVNKALKKLIAAGLVSVAKQGGFKRGPSSYRVHGVPDKPKGGSREDAHEQAGPGADAV